MTEKKCYPYFKFYEPKIGYARVRDKLNSRLRYAIQSGKHKKGLLFNTTVNKKEYKLVMNTLNSNIIHTTHGKIKITTQ